MTVDIIEPETESKKKKPAAVVRISFLDVVSAEMKNEQGQIVGVPEGFDTLKHKKPLQQDFADRADFLDFSANLFLEQAADRTAKATKYQEQAAELRKYGDPQKRKQVQKFQKLVDDLRAARAQMKEAGIDISLDELLADKS